jgi:hypothetical protein
MIIYKPHSGKYYKSYPFPAKNQGYLPNRYPTSVFHFNYDHFGIDSLGYSILRMRISTCGVSFISSTNFDGFVFP